MNHYNANSPRASQRGQTFLAIVFFIAILLLGVLGLSTDYVQLWAHRQMAQAAADAACQAGAADIFVDALNPSVAGSNGVQNFSWIGTTTTCAASPTTPPCRYASLNGYSGANVALSFPSSVPGVSALPSGFGTIANPYIKVQITDPVAMSFTQMVSPTSTVNVGATAYCGLNPITVPTPLVVLHRTASGSLSVGGSATITIYGGPNRSVQVESTSSTAVSVGTIDLSHAGPNGTGADFGVVGGPATKPASVNLGSSGTWISPASPFGDPWATIATPSKPSTAGTAAPVPFAFNGCPDPGGCVEFTAGDYTSCVTGSIANGSTGCLMFPYGGSNPKFSGNANSQYSSWTANKAYAAGTLIQPTNAQHNAGGYVYQAQGAGTSGGSAPNPFNQTFGQTTSDSGVTWMNVGTVVTNPGTAIFDPGLYYVGTNGLNIGQNSTVRTSTATGDGSNGITFYFSTSDTVSVSANAGKSSACTSATSGSSSPNNCIVSYNVSGAASSSATGSVPSRQLQCPGGAANPSQVPASIDGNILVGPCSGSYGSSDGKNRGFLFFQNRSVSASPGWGGGGQFLLSGFMYFHSGNGATCGTNTTCLTMNGGSGAGAYTLGNIVVDELSMTGNSGINMILNPAVTFQILKPQLLK